MKKVNKLFYKIISIILVGSIFFSAFDMAVLADENSMDKSNETQVLTEEDYSNNLNEWSVQAVWTESKDQTLIYHANENKSISIKLTFSYYLNNAVRKYEANEVKFSVKGIDTIKRGGKLKAETTTTQLNSEWTLNYDSSTDIYTFVYKNEIPINQSMSGGFQMQWTLNARDAINGYTYTASPGFSTNDGSINLPPLHFEYTSERDIYNVELKYERLTGAEIEDLELAREKNPQLSELDNNQKLRSYSWYKYVTKFSEELKSRGLYRSDYFVAISIAESTATSDYKIDLETDPTDIVVYDLDNNPINLTWIEDPATGELVYGFYKFTNYSGTIDLNDTYANKLKKDFIIGVNPNKVTQNKIVVSTRLIPLFNDEIEKFIDDNDYAGTLTARVENSHTLYGFVYSHYNWWHSKDKTTHKGSNLINNFYEGQTVYFRLTGSITKEYASSGSSANKAAIVPSGDGEEKDLNIDYPADGESFHFIQGDDYIYTELNNGELRMLDPEEYAYRSVHLITDKSAYDYDVYVSYTPMAAFEDYVMCGSGKTSVDKTITLPTNSSGEYPKAVYIDIKNVSRTYKPMVDLGIYIKFDWEKEKSKAYESQVKADNGQIINVSYMRLINNRVVNFASTSETHYDGFFKDYLMPNDLKIYNEYLYRNFDTVYLKSPTTNLGSSTAFSSFSQSSDGARYTSTITSEGTVSADESSSLKKFSVYTKIPDDLFLGDLKNITLTAKAVGEAPMDEAGNVIGTGRTFDSEDFKDKVSYRQFTDSSGTRYIAADFDFSDDPIESLTGASVKLTYPVYITAAQFATITSVEYIADSYTMVHDQGIEKIEAYNPMRDSPDLNGNGDYTEIVSHSFAKSTLNVLLKEWKEASEKFVKTDYSTGYVYAGDSDDAVRVDLKNGSEDTGSKYKYSYRLDFTIGENPIKDIVMYDAIEPSDITVNYFDKSIKLNSEWRGTLRSVDTSQLIKAGFSNITVYYTTAQVDITEDTEPLKKDSSAWKQMSESDNIWVPENGDTVGTIAVAIDPDKEYVGINTLATVIVNMEAPLRTEETISLVDKYTQNYFTTVCKQRMYSSTEYYTSEFKSAVTHVYLKETKPTLTIKKKDAESGKFLSGAVFTLYKDLQCKQPVEGFKNVVTDIFGEYTGEVPSTTTYYLCEMNAPLGYYRLAEALAVKVDGSENIVTVEDERVKGIVEFHKKDADDSLVNDLPGAKYELYTSSGSKVSTTDEYVYATGTAAVNSVFVTTNKGFTITGLPWGNYYLKEVEAPPGYDLNTSLVRFSLQRSNVNEDNILKAVLEQSDSEKTASIALTKSDAFDPSTTLNNAWYNVQRKTFDETGNVIWENVRTDLSTNAVGELTVDGLKFGEYRFVEIIAPKGYELSTSLNPQSVVLDADTVGQTLYFTQSDRQKTGSAQLIKVSNTNAPISGAVFDLYKINGKHDKNPGESSSGDAADSLYRSGIRSGADGRTPIISNLDWGEYYFVETKSVTGYSKSDTTYTPTSFSVNADNVDVMQVTRVVNYQIPGSVTLSKFGENTDNKLLDGAVFNLCDKDGTVIIQNIQKGTYDYNTKDKVSGSEETSGMFTVINVPWGSYYFDEVTAPNGYARSDKVRFTVNGANCLSVQELECVDPLVTCEITVNKKIDEALPQFGDPTFIFKVTNETSGEKLVKSMKLSSSKLNDSVTFSVQPGTYKIEEINVSRYVLDSVEVNNETTTTQKYSINEVKKIAECTLTSDDNGTSQKFEVTFKNKLKSFDKFNHVTATTNIIPVEKKITGISVKYNNEFIPLDAASDSSKYYIDKIKELTLTLIYDDGSEEVVDLTKNENMFIHTESEPDFIVLNGINHASDEVGLQAQYTVDGKTYKTTFYVTVAPAKVVVEQRVIYSVDSENRCYFNIDGKHPTANSVSYSEGTATQGTYSEPIAVIGAFMFSHWEDSSGNTFADENEITTYLKEHQDVTVLELTAVLKNGVKNYAYSGNIESFTAPVSGYYKLEAWGAQGGSVTENIYGSVKMDPVEGGRGGYSYGTVYLTKGQTIYIAVGGEGSEVISSALTGYTSNLGGFNGGGYATSDGSRNHSGSGGGATHFALATEDENGYPANGTLSSYVNTQDNVLIVAGGGGGSYNSSSIKYICAGGYGGGEIGGSGIVNYTGSKLPQANQYDVYEKNAEIVGGTQEAKTNDGHYIYGTFGQGTNAVKATSGTDAGGGGGWYGGAKYNANAGAGGMSGGGGSGHINQSAVTNGATIGGDQTFTSPSGTDETGHTGNGYARVTFISEEPLNKEFEYTESTQVFTAPKSGYYKLEAWGASGGSPNNTTQKGGVGAYTSGMIRLNEGDTIYVYVGGEGSVAYLNTALGGWNGGGNATEIQGRKMGSGGGATDFRLVQATDNNGWGGFDSLKSRIMVAGAGGGGLNYNWYSSNISSRDAKGGSGGTLEGLPGEANDPGYGITIYQGGTQTYGGWTIKGNTISDGIVVGVGSFGYAANTVGSSTTGGSGYYAGGTASHTTGSGGGSSFISGYTGCNAIAEESTEKHIIHTDQPNHYSGYVFINSVMIDGDSEMPTHDGTGTMIGNTGNGYAKITYLG